MNVKEKRGKGDYIIFFDRKRQEYIPVIIKDVHSGANLCYDQQINTPFSVLPWGSLRDSFVKQKSPA
jgi:hypothetical protein